MIFKNFLKLLYKKCIIINTYKCGFGAFAPGLIIILKNTLRVWKKNTKTYISKKTLRLHIEKTLGVIMGFAH
jgi:hypothetical protein